MKDFTEIQCGICDNRGFIFVELPRYRISFDKDGNERRSYIGEYTTLYNCVCIPNGLPGAKTYDEAGIIITNYEKDYRGSYMRRISD